MYLTGVRALGAAAVLAVVAALVSPTGSSRAAEGSPVGYGAGTTGGAGGEAVTVSDAESFTSAVSGEGAREVTVEGTIQLSDMVDVSSNKTIVGGGSGGSISGSGLNVSGASNVIIQGLSFSGSNDDAINVQESTNVWIDHNSVSSPADGGIDIKRASDNVTVSWNHIQGVGKAMLLGHDDGNGGQDTGKLHVTYYANWCDGTDQRCPRVRFGDPVHVFNNYYSNVGSYGVASTMDAGVLVEGNYFENTEDPFHLGEGDSGPGRLVARDNHFEGSGEGQAGGDVGNPPYSYNLTPAAEVKAMVMGGAGAGGGGGGSTPDPGYGSGGTEQPPPQEGGGGGSTPDPGYGSGGTEQPPPEEGEQPPPEEGEQPPPQEGEQPPPEEGEQPPPEEGEGDEEEDGGEDGDEDDDGDEDGDEDEDGDGTTPPEWGGNPPQYPWHY